MSSYFDEASLVMIPSGYKDQKIFSVKPLDGSGDLAFSRASSATRVASNGLIEKVRTNTLTYSQDLSNADWTKGSLTLTSGQADPNGGTSAFLATSTGTSSVWFFQDNTGAKTFSIYAKAGTKSFFSIINGLYNNGAGFDLSTQTVTNAGVGSLAKIESVGNGWYRCSVYVSTSFSMFVMLADISGGSMVNGDTMSFAFAQAETGDIATDYIATTTAAVSVGPVSGLPRLDYLNSTCPRLLLEPQRSNLALYSEQFGTASYWFANNSTITSNNAVSPDGYTNADMYTAAGNGNFLNASATSTGSNTVTFSVFAKAGTAGQFRIREAFYFGTSTVFNLATGTIISGTGTITNYGNGWYRCTHTQAYGAGETSVSFTYDLNGAVSGTAYLWGAQAEVGAYATSYIPTLGTSVTRVADTASKTGISSLIGQTEGTLFVDLSETSEIDIPEITIDDNTNNNRILFTRNLANGFWSIFTASAGVGGVSSGTTTGNSGKFALAYSSAGYVLYRNGVQVATRTAALPVSLSAIRLNGRATSDFFSAKKVAQALLFKTRLSNSDLAAITTL